ncbi:hypothetical protein TIFTF001_037711 [Ficus carica]|uniref:Cytochrome P450 n=1 Tax=Ficus carica TaxID=3494 RepID=A0AA88EHE8_FICCA|nr:hypothetical protein TIFTF001_037711 [Ficus carica]
MLRNRPADQWIHRLMKELNTDIACFQLGNSHVITVNSPEIAREFLKRHDAVFASRPETMATCIISRGNLTTALNQRGEQWKKMRRVLVSEVLSHSKMNWLLDMRNQEADNLVRFLYSQCSKTFKATRGCQRRVTVDSFRPRKAGIGVRKLPEVSELEKVIVKEKGETF